MEHIRKWISSLSNSLGRPREQFPLDRYKRHFDRKDIVAIVRDIKDEMRISVGLRIGFVNSGGPPAAAWINIPDPMPPLGTPEYLDLNLTMYIKRYFLAIAPYEAVVLTIAHELAHIVLESIGQKDRREEKVVDLATMVLGYGEFYASGLRFDVAKLSQTETLCAKVCYLTEYEMHEARRIIRLGL